MDGRFSALIKSLQTNSYRVPPLVFLVPETTARTCYGYFLLQYLKERSPAALQRGRLDRRWNVGLVESDLINHPAV
jgi:hypothetical protein